MDVTDFFRQKRLPCRSVSDCSIVAIVNNRKNIRLSVTGALLIIAQAYYVHNPCRMEQALIFSMSIYESRSI